MSFSACGQVHNERSTFVNRSPRFEAMKRGLSLRISKPEEAARAFSEAGIGAELEQMRFTVWIQSLERGRPSAADWRDFLNQEPPKDLADRAKEALARILMAEGEWDHASHVLAGMSSAATVRAEVLRLDWPDQTRDAAAIRLAVSAPVVLRREAPGLEKAAVAALGAEQILNRCVAWRDAGHPKRAAAELRALKVGGPLESLRRLELARCELSRGSTSSALSILPPLSQCDGDQALVRASSWRRRGWSQYPRPAAVEAFRNCLSAAQKARSVDSGSPIQALELQLECGTEGGALRSALAAWESLATAQWKGSRRSWLGRRLGVALAASGQFPEALDSLSLSLNDDVRCLRYAAATATPAINHQAMDSLAAAPIPDIYALWALDFDGRRGPETLQLAEDLKGTPPPSTVQWLTDLGEPGLASQEWRRLAEIRGVLPGEALNAAELEVDRGRPDLAIRWLRKGFADLGGANMERVPGNVVRAYLPLRWTHDLKLAAREFDVTPWLLAGLARQESIFNERARSPAGARGIVQLMQGTARGHAVALGLGRSPDLYDPVVNLRLGARELSRLINAFGDIEPALAAYNAGESRVRTWWRRWPDRHQFTEAVPIPETYTYIRRVRFLSEAYRLVWAEEWDESSFQN